MRSVGKVLVIFSFLSICFNPTLELRGNGENEPSLLDVMKGRQIQRLQRLENAKVSDLIPPILRPSTLLSTS
ncbi:hypothetical protein RB195_009795 [Necator americanus]|uniref:Corticotropin-releasing factor domain-containing protein n=1 Tax=Necator americanus TaxID=51031 RepID=A0ABR1CW72_NECAM